MTILHETPTPSITRLILNRPQRCNALCGRLLRELLKHLELLRIDRKCRILLLESRGPHFCAGMDLNEAGEDEGMAYHLTSQVVETILRLRQLPQVVVTAVQGAARGGGAGLAVASDLVLASEDASFAFPEVRRGLEPVLLFPLLRRRFDDGVLRRLLLTGKPIDAARASQIGMVMEVVPHEQLAEKARDLAEDLIRTAPEALRNTKRMLTANENTRFTPSLAEEFRATLDAHAQSWASPEAREGIAAFLEKRFPDWDWQYRGND